MPRKTRAQKIQSSQRKTSHQELAASASPVTVTPANPTASNTPRKIAPAQTAAHAQTADFTYVSKDLHHIAWTALTCIVLLAIATLFLSDFPLIQSARQALHLPTLSL